MVLGSGKVRDVTFFAQVSNWHEIVSNYWLLNIETFFKYGIKTLVLILFDFYWSFRFLFNCFFLFTSIITIIWLIQNFVAVINSSRVSRFLSRARIFCFYCFHLLKYHLNGWLNHVGCRLSQDSIQSAQDIILDFTFVFLDFARPLTFLQLLKDLLM